MGMSKLTRNFQVTIPRDVRQIKGLEAGDKVIFAIEGERVDIVKVTKDIIKETAGIWPEIKVSGTDYQKRIRKSWGTRVKREFS